MPVHGVPVRRGEQDLLLDRDSGRSRYRNRFLHPASIKGASFWLLAFYRRLIRLNLLK